MRLVIATTADDPLAPVFWEAYRAAAGPPAVTVFFLRPRRRASAFRRVGEGLLLFGLTGALYWWQQQRRLRRPADPLLPLAAGTRVQHVASLNRGGGHQALRDAQADVLVSVGSPEIFKPSTLGLARWGALNVHHGRLPTYRGLFATFWEALHGEAWGYTTVHRMDAGIDTGAVVAEARVPLGRRHLLEVLVEKRQVGGRLLAEVLARTAAAGALPPAVPRRDGAVGYYSWPSLADLLRFRLGTRGGARGGPVRAGDALGQGGGR